MITKILTLLMFFNTLIFACDANCVVCHPKLVNKNGKMDNNHKILRNCVKCHTKNLDEKDHDSCGADCWSCHKIENVKPANIKEHQAIKKCIACHASLDKKLFKIEPKEKKGFLINSL